MSVSEAHLEQLATLLVATDPRKAADTVLGFLISQAAARAGAVLLVNPAGELSVFVSRSVTLDAMLTIRAAWADRNRQRRLGRGGETGFVLEPLADHEQVVALLYLEAPRRVDPSALAVFGVPLAKAALAAATDVPRALDAYLRSTAPEDLQKEQLIRVLAENEWNVARVARVLKVTRRTIYLRMERYGITRKKVPKTVKRTAFA